MPECLRLFPLVGGGLLHARPGEEVCNNQAGDEECVLEALAPHSLSVVAAAMGRHEASAREVDSCGRWQHRGACASVRPHALPSMTRSRLRFAEASAEHPIVQNVLDLAGTIAWRCDAGFSMVGLASAGPGGTRRREQWQIPRFHSARTVPVRCPYGARTVPVRCPL